MTTDQQLNAKQLIDIFQNLGLAFQQFSNTPIIPKELLLMKKENGRTDKDFTSFSPVKRQKISDSEVVKEKPIDKEDIYESEEEKKESDFYESESESHSQQVSEAKKEDKTLTPTDYGDEKIIFIENQGWEFRLKFCGMSVEMGPFISRVKASAVIEFIKSNKPQLEKMSKKQKKLWLTSVSNLIETLLK